MAKKILGTVIRDVSKINGVTATSLLRMNSKPVFGKAMGATNNPYYPSYYTAGANLVAIPWVASVTNTNTTTLAAGTWTTPKQASSANTKYVLQGNATANTTGIEVTADYVIIDLNGYTLTYNQTGPGQGVVPGGWNIDHVAVINGSIVQGTSNDGTIAGDFGDYGIGSNPISGYNILDSENYGISDTQVSNVYVEYSGNGIGGIQWNSALFAENVAKDTCTYGTLPDRGLGPDAIGYDEGTSGIVRNNTIINCKQKGIKLDTGGSAYNNIVSINSHDTNSYGISSYSASDSTVYNNTITGVGVHPVGIGVLSDLTHNVDVYDNYIRLQKTMNGGDGSGDTATGIRAGSYGADCEPSETISDIVIWNNEVYITTDNSYSGKNAEDGSAATVESKGKGLMLGAGTDTGSVTAANNLVILTGDGEALGIAPHCNDSESLFVLKNTIVSPDTNVCLEDVYCCIKGFALFAGNNFVKTGAAAGYYTVSAKLDGWYPQEARFVDNTYSGGAAESSRFFGESDNSTFDVYFGHIIEGSWKYDLRCQDAGNTVINPPETRTYAVPADYDSWGEPPTL